MSEQNIPKGAPKPQALDNVIIMSMHEYPQAVECGKIPKDPNHHHLLNLVNQPGSHEENKIIVLSCLRQSSELQVNVK